MPDFKGRVAIVTGAASGIGKQIALRLAAAAMTTMPDQPKPDLPSHTMTATP